MREATRRLTVTLRGVVVAAVLGATTSACAMQSAPPPGSSRDGSGPAPTQTSAGPSLRNLDAREAQRLQRIMAPLVLGMNRPRSLSQVKVGIMDDSHINAASAGGGSFYITTGLLQKANDAQLAGVLAH